MKVLGPCDTPSWICSSMGCQERPCSFRECNSSPKRKVPLPGSLSITRVPQELWTQATPKIARGKHNHPFSRKQPLCETVGHLHLVCSSICFEIGVHYAPPSLALACDPQPSECWTYKFIAPYLTDTCSSVPSTSLPNLWFALGLFVPAEWEGWTWKVEQDQLDSGLVINTKYRTGTYIPFNLIGRSQNPACLPPQRCLSKASEFLRVAQMLVSLLWCICQQFWYIATRWQ